MRINISCGSTSKKMQVKKSPVEMHVNPIKSVLYCRINRDKAIALFLSFDIKFYFINVNKN